MLCGIVATVNFVQLRVRPMSDALRPVVVERATPADCQGRLTRSVHITFFFYYYVAVFDFCVSFFLLRRGGLDPSSR